MSCRLALGPLGLVGELIGIGEILLEQIFFIHSKPGQQGSCPTPVLQTPDVSQTEGIAVKVGATETDGCWEG